jgi:hypothetical protein
VILSLLLPRADTLNKTVISLNEEIKKEFEDTPHTVTVNHPNITQEDLKDRKHLTPKGVKCLAKNLKASFFGTTPKPAGKPQMKRPPFAAQTDFRNYPHPRPYQHFHHQHSHNPQNQLPSPTTRRYPLPPIIPHLPQPTLQTPHPTWTNNKKTVPPQMIQLIEELNRYIKQAR